jgi:hypothetical protein
VPVNALIQHRPAEKDKGGIIAAANLLSFVGSRSRRVSTTSSPRSFISIPAE